MMKGTSLQTGKRGELRVFMKLLEEGIVPYVPIVDVEGTDAVVRTPDGRYLGLQIKTRKPEAKYRRYFEVSNFQASDNFFIVCVEDRGDTWILPSFVFKKYGTTPGKGTRGLDLDQAPDRHFIQRKRKDILAPYKNNWDLLKNSEEDLVDLIAMYEALASPEEEATDWEDYKKRQEQRVHSQDT